MPRVRRSGNREAPIISPEAVWAVVQPRAQAPAAQTWAVLLGQIPSPACAPVPSAAKWGDRSVIRLL